MSPAVLLLPRLRRERSPEHPSDLFRRGTRVLLGHRQGCSAGRARGLPEGPRSFGRVVSEATVTAESTDVKRLPSLHLSPEKQADAPGNEDRKHGRIFAHTTDRWRFGQMGQPPVARCRRRRLRVQRAVSATSACYSGDCLPSSAGTNTPRASIASNLNLSAASTNSDFARCRSASTIPINS